jgi:Lrp/AsnC family transcriptional regulator for asnA, asnC and gidA
MQPDKTDWKIIDLLRREHMSNSTVARELGVSEGMVRNRIQRLKEAGILTVRALINPDVLADSQLAVVAVKVAETRLLDQKAHEIARLEHVQSVSIASGRYDLIVEVLVDSNHGLVKFLTEQLSKVKDISSTETFLLLKSVGKYV